MPISLDDIRLYVILDIPTLHRAKRDAADIMREVYPLGVRVFQLRHKSVSSGELYREAVHLVDVARELGALLIVNDDLSVALASDADGVHLGEEDLPVSAARRIAPEGFIIGASASSIASAIQAERDGADYIGYGALFPTETKRDAKAGKLDELVEIVNEVDIPVFAIGGIDEDNVEEVVKAGCGRVCVASGIILAKSPSRAVKNIIGALEKR